MSKLENKVFRMFTEFVKKCEENGWNYETEKLNNNLYNIYLDDAEIIQIGAKETYYRCKEAVNLEYLTDLITTLNEIRKNFG